MSKKTGKKSPNLSWSVIQMTLTPEETDVFVGIEIAKEQLHDVLHALVVAGNNVKISYDPEREEFSVLVICIDPESPNAGQMFYSNAEELDVAIFLAEFKLSLLENLKDWSLRSNGARRAFR